MKTTTWILGLVVLAIAALGCTQTTDSVATNATVDGSQPAAGTADDEDDGAEEDEVETPVALTDVPAVVLAAARGALPGVTLTGAIRETEDGGTVYELTGTAGGRQYDIEVSPAGKVLEVEESDDD